MSGARILHRRRTASSGGAGTDGGKSRKEGGAIRFVKGTIFS
jgi:hypothetical protein